MDTEFYMSIGKRLSACRNNHLIFIHELRLTRTGYTHLIVKAQGTTVGVYRNYRSNFQVTLQDLLNALREAYELDVENYSVLLSCVIGPRTLFISDLGEN